MKFLLVQTNRENETEHHNINDEKDLLCHLEMLNATGQKLLYIRNLNEDDSLAMERVKKLIIEGTEQKRVVVCNERSYEVPKDVADELEMMREKIMDAEETAQNNAIEKDLL